MPIKRLTMRKIREILRLKFDCQLTYGQIATSCRIGRSTVFDYLKRFKATALDWPLPSDIDDARLSSFCTHLPRSIIPPKEPLPLSIAGIFTANCVAKASR